MSAVIAQRGQAAVEYLGVLLVVSVIIAMIASNGLGRDVGRATARQVCLIVNDASDCPVSGAERERRARVREQRAARRDSDRDRVPDRLERRHGTNPRRADSDGDGIGDAAEIRGRTAGRAAPGPIARAAQRGGRPGPVFQPGPNKRPLTPRELRARALRMPVTAPRVTTIPNRGGVIRTEGLDSLGRPIGMVERSRPSSLSAPRDDRRFTPKGFKEATDAGLAPNRSHLSPRERGAPGDDPGNFYVAPQAFNQVIMRRYERIVRQIFRDGDNALIEQVPIYYGREMIPRSIQVNIWRTRDGKDIFVVGKCINVWPKGVPKNVPLG
jgi:hypothetical protein